MKIERLYLILLVVAILMLHEPVDAGKKKVIIHVPYRVKNVKHTHTIYKIMPHHQHHHLEKKDEQVEEQESEEFDHFKKK